MKHFALALFLFSAAGISAQNNSVIIEAHFKASGKCSSDTTFNKVVYHVRNDILRVDMNGPTANSSIIFQPASGKIWVLFHLEQVYYSMTREEMDSLEWKVRQESAAFDSAMARLSGKDREATLAAWPDGNPFVFEEAQYSLVKKKDSLINNLLCDKYSGGLNKDNLKITFLNNLKTTGITFDEIAILSEFSQFMGKGVKALSGNMDFCSVRKLEAGGLPILTQNFKGDILCSRFEIVRIWRAKTGNSRYQIPVSYSRFENPLGRLE